MKNFLFLASLIFLSACETAPPEDYAEWPGVHYSVEGIIKAFDHVAPGGGIRGKSANGREIYSKYHPPSGDIYANATTAKVRSYTKLAILGDRRPYVLQVSFIIEDRDDDGNYTVTQRDQVRAKKILRDLRKFLATRPDKDNFIDDFRPF